MPRQCTTRCPENYSAFPSAVDRSLRCACRFSPRKTAREHFVRSPLPREISSDRVPEDSARHTDAPRVHLPRQQIVFFQGASSICPHFLGKRGTMQSCSSPLGMHAFSPAHAWKHDPDQLSRLSANVPLPGVNVPLRPSSSNDASPLHRPNSSTGRDTVRVCGDSS